MKTYIFRNGGIPRGALALDAMLYSVKGEIESIIDKKCHNNKLYLGMGGFPVGALASKDTGCKSSARLKWWVCSRFHYSPQGTNTITNIVNIATIATITTILLANTTVTPLIICIIFIVKQEPVSGDYYSLLSPPRIGRLICQF